MSRPQLAALLVPRVRALRVQGVAFALIVVLGVQACRAVKTETAPLEPEVPAFLTDAFTTAHAIRVHVSAVNCEMNAADAERLNSIALTAGLMVEVVFSGIDERDTLVLARAKADLGLKVSTRLVRDAELEQYKSIGGARLPMALVFKAKQLKTFIAGESMPRTLSLLEASMSPRGGQ